MSAYDEKTVLAQLATGDGTAFNQIYRRYRDTLFSITNAFLKDPDSANDIVQQVFIRVWEKRARLSGIDNFQSYVVVMSRNLICDAWRRRCIESRILFQLAACMENVDPDNAARFVQEGEYFRLYWLAVKMLPPQQQKVSLLIIEEGLSYKKAALVLGLSKFTVKRHLELARRYLRSHMGRVPIFYNT